MKFILVPILTLLSFFGFTQSPIVITQGGTYSAGYRGTATQPAISVQTSQPVVITGIVEGINGQNAIDISGYGNVNVKAAKITRIVTQGSNEQPGRAVFAYKPRRLVVEHCEIVGGNGVIIQNEDETGLMDSIIVRYNSFTGITKVKPDGSEGGAHAHSIQLNAIHNSNSVLIYGNRMYGVAGESNEDIVNVNESYPVDGKFIDIYNNLLTGAYIYPITRTDGYTGSGFTIETASKHVRFHNNVVLDCMNALINISEGGPTNNDNLITNNYMVSAGIPRGAENLRPFAYWSGAAIYYYSSDSGRNNFIINNTIGYVSNRNLSHFFPVNGRHDENNYQRPAYSTPPPPGVGPNLNRMPYRPNTTINGYNTYLSYTPTKATEDSAIARWDAAILASGNYVGITKPLTTTTPIKGSVIIVNGGVSVQIRDSLNGRAITIADDSAETTYKVGTIDYYSTEPTIVRVLENPKDETLFTLKAIKVGKATITVMAYTVDGILIKKSFLVDVAQKAATGFSIILTPV